MLDNTATSADIARHTYRPEPFPESLDIPRVDPSIRALSVKLGAEALHRQAQERLTERRWGNRFGKMWAEYHTKSAPLIAPIALLAVVAAWATLKLTIGG